MQPTPEPLDNHLQANRKMWDEFVSINSRSEMYKLDEFKKGSNKLHPLERDEVGEVKGKSLLHLQCHFGMDTLSWARLGANVTGMDFSPKGIELAQSLSRELNIPARFICCNLYDLSAQLDKQFDIVYTSYGVLCWLPDITRWAQIVAQYVKPGGFFYMVEFHPFEYVFDDDKKVKELKVRYPYFQEDPFEFEVDGSYADALTKIEPQKEYEWTHGVGEVISSLIAAGLHLDFFHEFPYTCYADLPFLEKGTDGNWRLPKETPTIPLTYSIKATKLV
jgi:SAM-dependent methyltransferase